LLAPLLDERNFTFMLETTQKTQTQNTVDVTAGDKNEKLIA